MIYADASFFVALTTRRDTFHGAAARYYHQRQDELWLWSPWHRVEVFNTLRQLSLHPDRKRRLASTEVSTAVYLIEADVRAGYFTHMETDWRDVLRAANEISIAHGVRLPCRSADLLHVAYAKELSAELFIGFDADQLDLAKAAGLPTQRPR
jgi:predicted nucleic acid-binding protein